MKSIELGKATGPLADYAAAIEEGPVVVTKRGRPVAALIPIGKADLESVLLSVNPRFQAIIKRSRAEYKRKGGLSAAELRDRLAKHPER
ncbi:MAG TPA: type II toxin-antitoxin system prevent-host-death family antitoxin [Thermoanaerobaculia bacterium]|jgi:antitoxin (DNA-binding transcriptional repressor) of toxin-antitoxin stability system|nr:type II toxin-antitoxin system prevent-host-death family antitoxin [Thermoanaerobaculia bacterium]